MSREAYAPPTLIPQPSIYGSGGPSTTTTTAATTTANAAGMQETTRPVTYICGDCAAKVSLRRQDPIRCKECGHRVLYKERTNR